MFSFLSNRLTELSHNYIDWSRVGFFLRLGNHRYSRDELLQRGSIIATAATFAFVGNYLNNPDKTQLSNTSMALFMGTLGFTLAHTMTMMPLVLKRVKISHECGALVSEIKEKIAPLPTDQQEAILSKVKNALEVSLSNAKQASATQTWGRRRTLLLQIRDEINFQKQYHSFTL